jgi:hypothetical protein
MAAAETKFKVYLETSDGRVMEVPAIAINISSRVTSRHTYEDGYGEQFSIDGPVETTIELTAIGSMTWMRREGWIKEVNERRSQTEWQCDYCGRANGKGKETCSSCGANRSFIYLD